MFRQNLTILGCWPWVILFVWHRCKAVYSRASSDAWYRVTEQARR
jgi:hypothetical protein